MSTRRAVVCTRREALAAVAVGALAAGAVSAPAAAQRSSVSGGGGIAGGGVARTPDGEAQFSLFATSLRLEGEEEPVVFGRVQWMDPNWRSQGVTLESTSVTSYGPPEDDPDARELRGLMTADGEGSYPFVLRAVDAGPPGFGQDSVRLTVGPGAEAGTPAATAGGDFAYSVEARLVGGDLQLLSFETPNQG